MSYFKLFAMASVMLFCTSSCSGNGKMDTDDTVKTDTIHTEMTESADNNITPEAIKALAKKVADKEDLTSSDYNAMLDYVLVMGAKMGEAMNKVDIDALTKIPEEYPESDIFLKALEDAAASNKLDKGQLDKAKQFKKLIGEDEI